ncbi:restriction endonuclease subunit S [Salmonella enterica subsp. enterica serovar Tafo]|nr:restriction endonuclease subunit S [Salmonella enterica subsp. enterica serovar Tafo]
MSNLMPKEWILGKASDFVVSPKNDIVDGPFGSNLKASEYQLSGTPIIRLQNIKRLRFINKNIKYVSNEKAIELSRHSYKKGDIVITKLGDPLGLACIIPENFQDGVIVADLVRLRINDLVFDKRFLTYLLNSPLVISQLNKHIKGTTRPRINLGIIRDLNLPIASISEQKIIAEKLDTLLAQVDSTKARLECAFNKIEMFKRAVMDFAVKGDLTKEWRNKNEINEWEITHWENILLDKKDSFRRGPFGGALKKDIFVERGYKVYEQYCPINDDCSFSRYYITEEKFHEMNKFEVHAGDFLISGAGSIGKITLVPEGCEKGIINQALLRVRINNEIYDKKFFLTLFRSPMFQKVIIENSTGSAMQNLKSIKELKQIPVPLPCLSEQHEIVRRVEQLFAYADTIEKQVNNALTRVNNLTQSILAKAFRGELTAQWRAENPELISGENSAAALLEKIKAERAASGGKKTSRKKA